MNFHILASSKSATATLGLLVHAAGKRFTITKHTVCSTNSSHTKNTSCMEVTIPFYRNYLLRNKITEKSC